MKNFETSVKLSLWQNSANIYLIINVSMPQYKGKMLTPPESPTYVENDKSNILLSYIEEEDENVVVTSQIQNNYPVHLGTIEGEPTTNPLDTLAECVEATAGNTEPILSQYTVTVQITEGDDTRKTVTHITEDADIDMRILAELYPGAPNNQA